MSPSQVPDQARCPAWPLDIRDRLHASAPVISNAVAVGLCTQRSDLPLSLRGVTLIANTLPSLRAGVQRDLSANGLAGVLEHWRRQGRSAAAPGLSWSVLVMRRIDGLPPFPGLDWRLGFFIAWC
jgi:hypothetical protein